MKDGPNTIDQYFSTEIFRSVLRQICLDLHALLGTDIARSCEMNVAVTLGTYLAKAAQAREAIASLENVRALGETAADVEARRDCLKAQRIYLRMIEATTAFLRCCIEVDEAESKFKDALCTELSTRPPADRRPPP